MNKYFKENKRVLSMFLVFTMILTFVFANVQIVNVKAAEGENLLKNGDFSEWENKNKILINWNHDGYIKEEVTKITSPSLRITGAIKNDKKLNQTIKNIVPGKEYVVSFWYNKQTKMKCRPWMYWLKGSTLIKGNDKKLRPSKYLENTNLKNGNNGWEKWHETVVAPEEATGFIYEIRTYDLKEKDETQIVYIDDCYFGLAEGGNPNPNPGVDRVKKVKANPPSGVIEENGKVVLSTETEGADIYYDFESFETTASAIAFTEPIAITEDKNTIYAVGVKEGFENSDLAKFEYEILEEEEITPIYEIQGAGHISPKLNQTVTTRGVVTALSGDKYYYGLFIQDLKGDKDIKTSDGLYIHQKNIDGIKVGDIVLVTGKVKEIQHKSQNYSSQMLTVTQLWNSHIEVVGKASEIPEPIIIGKGGREIITDNIDNDNMNSFDPDEDAIDLYESLEGMLVKVNDPLIVGVAEAYGTFSVLADNGEKSTGKLSDTKGILTFEEGPNAEILNVDDVIHSLVNSSKQFKDARFQDAAVGDSFSGSITGVMDYNFGFYKIYNTEKLPNLTKGGNLPENSELAFDKDKLNIAMYNVENFYKGVSQEKIDRIASSIVQRLNTPDIIALVEIQDNDGRTNNGITEADESYGALIDAIKDVDPNAVYSWTDIAPENNKDGGASGGNIRVGYIYNPNRVGFNLDKGGVYEAAGMNGVHLKKNPSRVDPTNPAFNSSRKPLAAEFLFNGESVFVIATHFASKRGDDGDFGPKQPPVKGSEKNRHKQALAVNALVEEIQEAVPEAKVVVLGDMNDYQYSVTLDKLKGDELVNLIDTLPRGDQHTYVFNGNSQVLDNILVSKCMVENSEVDIVHINSEFTEHAGRASDHDPVMVQIDGLGQETVVGNVEIEPKDTFMKVGSKIQLTTDTLGAEIYYSFGEESNPKTEGNLYNGELVLEETGDITIKAVAKQGEDYGLVTKTTKRVDFDNLTISKEGGDITNTEGVTATVEEDDVEILYSVDGTTPKEVFPEQGLTFEKDTTLIISLRKGNKISNVHYKYDFAVLDEDGCIKIAKARQLDKGETVKIKGIVTSVIGTSAFVQDDTSGMYIYNGGTQHPELVKGNEVMITGNLDEFGNGKQIKLPTEVELVSEGNQVPAPKVITAKNAVEENEGVLVRINNLVITGMVKGKAGAVKEYTLSATDGTGNVNIRVDKYVDKGIDSSNYPEGTKVNITAPLNQFYENYQLCISAESEIEIVNEDEIDPPVMSIDSGKVEVGTVVKITTTQNNGEILYTVDGSDPKENGKAYETGIELATVGEVTIKAVVKYDGRYSEVVTSEYTVKEKDQEEIDPPAMSIEGGNVEVGTLVEITTTQNNGEILYTLDGSDPKESGKVYETAIELSTPGEVTMKAVVKYDGRYSEVVTEEYTVEAKLTCIKINEARELDNGTKVKVKGIVTAVIGTAAFIQDDTSGIYIHNGKTKRPELVKGNEVMITGNLDEYNKGKQIKYPKEVELISEGNQVPTPKVITAEKATEENEGILGRIENLVITGMASGKEGAVKEYTLSAEDGTGTVNIRVDKYIDEEIDSSKYPAGTKVNVTAPLNQFYENYQLCLSAESDIEIVKEEEVLPPVISIKGGKVEVGTIVEITLQEDKGEVLYTVDGSDPRENGKVYKTGIELATVGEVTIKAVVKYDGRYSEVVAEEYTVEPKEPVALPSMSIKGGKVEVGTVVEITTTQNDGEILYTVDGSDPKENGKVYKTGIELATAGEVTIKAVVKYDGRYSEVVSEQYTVEPEEEEEIVPPVISVKGGKVEVGTVVEITSSEDKGEILYTVDGSDPRENGKVYKTGIELSTVGTATVKAVVKYEGRYSEIVAENYEVVAKVLLPVISVSDGNIEKGTVVTLGVQDNKGEVLYTIDGSDPRENGKVYNNPIKLEELGQIVIKAVTKYDGRYSDIKKVECCVVEVEVSLNIKMYNQEKKETNTFDRDDNLLVYMTLESNCDFQGSLVYKIKKRQVNYATDQWRHLILVEDKPCEYHFGETLKDFVPGTYEVEIFVVKNTGDKESDYRELIKYTNCIMEVVK